MHIAHFLNLYGADMRLTRADGSHITLHFYHYMYRTQAMRGSYVRHETILAISAADKVTMATFA